MSGRDMRVVTKERCVSRTELLHVRTAFVRFLRGLVSMVSSFRHAQTGQTTADAGICLSSWYVHRTCVYVFISMPARQ